MLTFIIVVVVASFISWGIETWCRASTPDSINSETFVRDWQALKNEVTGIKTGVTSLGWNILWPVIPLIALFCLVYWAITHNS